MGLEPEPGLELEQPQLEEVPRSELGQEEQAPPRALATCAW